MSNICCGPSVGALTCRVDGGTSRSSPTSTNDAAPRTVLVYDQGSRAPVAQWIEHQTSDLRVEGSNPSRRTTSVSPADRPRLIPSVDSPSSWGGQRSRAWGPLVRRSLHPGGKEPGEFYTLNCSACHGANRVGISGLGLPLTPDVLSEDDAFYFDTIKNGRIGTVMPKWGESSLSDDDINALGAFIRTEP